MRLLFILVFILSALGFSYAGETPPLPGSLFCPPVENLTDGLCTMKCPEGYHPTGQIAGGLYACVPDNINNPSEVWKTCYYYDPDCEKETDVEKTVKETFAKGLEEFWDTKRPLVETLIGLASFDPEAVSSLEKTASAPKFRLVAQMVKDLSEAFLTAFFKLLVLVLSALAGLVSSYYILSTFELPFLSREIRETMVSHIESRFPELRVPVVFVLRVLFAVLITFTPVGVSYVNGEKVYITAVQKIVEKVALEGSRAADVVSHNITGAFFIYTGEILKEIAEKNSVISEEAVKEAQKNLERALQKAKKCVEVYGNVDLTSIPDEELYKVPVLNSEKARFLTRKYCKNIEKEYKWVLNNYANLYMAYKRSDHFKKWIEKENLGVSIAKYADELSKEDAFTFKVIKDQKKAALIAMAVVAKSVRDYGWFALPVVLFPTAETLSSSSDSLGDISALLSSPSPDQGLLVKIIATISFPPGSWIFSTLTKIATPIAEAAGSAVGSPLKAIPFVGKFLGSLGEAAGKLVSVLGMYAGVIILTYLVSTVLLKTAPVLFLAIVVSLRVFFWLLDISKTIMVSPLAVILAMSNQPQRFWGFVVNLLILGLYPLLIIASALLAYFASVILADTAFYIPLNAVLSYLSKIGFFDVLRLSVSPDTEISTGGAVFTPVVMATVYYLNFLLKVFVIWTIGMNGPEKFLQILRLNEWTMSTGEIREVAEQMKRPASPV